MEGNQMKIREALKQALYFLRRHHMGAVYAPDGETLIFCEDVAKIVDEALSSPPRNCDVGTAEEQTKRYVDFCAEHRHTGLPRCAGCPLENTPSDTGCIFAWSQMPYEAKEGGAK